MHNRKSNRSVRQPFSHPRPNAPRYIGRRFGSRPTRLETSPSLQPPRAPAWFPVAVEPGGKFLPTVSNTLVPAWLTRRGISWPPSRATAFVQSGTGKSCRGISWPPSRANAFVQSGTGKNCRGISWPPSRATAFVQSGNGLNAIECGFMATSADERD